jgi:7,8-dihydropterin-6-yl-methyl-4-(beta-D-ribofuranosyl)aminobenzene 5'-phosphate synthase
MHTRYSVSFVFRPLFADSSVVVVETIMNKTNIQIQVLVENTAAGKDILAEHGISFHITTGDHSILLDTGQGFVLSNNASIMNIDLRQVESIVLSHGHYDHCGGLRFFTDPDNTTRIYAHPAAFLPKFAKNKQNQIYPVGIAAVLEQHLPQLQQRAVFTEEPTEIINGLWVTGQVPRVNDFEQSSGRFYLDQQGQQPDDLIDDQSMFFKTTQGIIVLLGCAHAGIINTLQYIQSLTGNIPFHYVIGGTHLVNASKQRMLQTIEQLHKLNVQNIAPCHCTGLSTRIDLHNAFQEQCTECKIGTSYNFELI